MVIIMHVEYLIKEIRIKKGITIRELHKKSNVSIGHISEIENGIKDPTFTVLVRIAYALGEPLNNLYKIKL